MGEDSGVALGRRAIEWCPYGPWKVWRWVLAGMPDCCLEHVYQTRLLLLDPPGGDVRLTAIGRWRMDQVVERPAALDVHKEQVTACVRVPGEGGERREEGGGFKATGRGAAGGGAGVQDDCAELARVARLAVGVGCHACGDGGHRRVLVAGVGDSGGRVRVVVVQRGAREEPSGSQDRCRR